MKYAAHKFFLALLSVSILQTACGDDFVPNVDERVIPYYERFAQEAALRGVEFDNDKERIEASISNLSSQSNGDILGFCSPEQVRSPIRSITLNRDFWNTATDLEKEFLIFHELGHCFLERMHPEPPPVDGQGNCLTIMAAGSANCQGIEVYSEENRQDLLDELFAN